jgi:anaerobic selenocysteine-containing dehydrogenase
MPPMQTQSATTTHHRICPLCEACCGLEIQVQDHQVISIRGHEGDSFSQGYICPKGIALKDLHEDPDRLRQPLIKRNGHHEPATWAEALAHIEAHLPALMARHGRNAVGVVAGNPVAHKIGLMLYLPRLVKALGTQQFFSATTLDQMPRHVVSGLLYGHWMSVPVPDLPRTDWLLVLGANPVASNGSMWTVPDFKGKARALQARGGRLIVIDPRRTETAALANEHHFIRPGSDVFLLLGMVHSLFAHDLIQTGRLTPWLDGLDAVRQAVTAYTPESMAQRCGVPALVIHRLAQELATTPRAAIYGRIGTCTQAFGTLNTWLIDLLNLLTGHLDEVGGSLFPKAAAFAANTVGPAGRGRGTVTARHSSRVSGAPEVMGEFPMGCLAEEIETPGTGQIRALFTVGTNPVLSAPNGDRLAGALESLDFMVSLDIYLNETTRHADVILPGPSPLEDLHYDVPFPQLAWRNHARYSAPVLTRPADQPAEWETLLRLAAIARGQGVVDNVAPLDDAYFQEELRKAGGSPPPTLDPATATAQVEHAADVAVPSATPLLQGPDRLLDLALRTGPYGDGPQGPDRGGLTLNTLRQAPDGIDLGELQPRIPELLRTPDGRINLAPVALLHDLERATAALAEPVPEYMIIGRRDVRSNNSWMHNLPLLAKGPMRCTALMHPQDAARLGLTTGAFVRIRNSIGNSKTLDNNTHKTLRAEVSISNDMMPGIVSLPHGWGHHLPGTRLSVAAQRPGVNLNHLLDESLRDPLSGNAVLSGLAITLELDI